MIDKLIEPVTHILDKFVADKDLKAKLDHEIKTQFYKIDLAQIEVNKVEASHRSIFVSCSILILVQFNKILCID